MHTQVLDALWGRSSEAQLAGCPPADPISSTAASSTVTWSPGRAGPAPGGSVSSEGPHILASPCCPESAATHVPCWPGVVFLSSCFFCISVFKTFKFPAVSEESQEGEAAGADGQKRREEAGEESRGKGHKALRECEQVGNECCSRALPGPAAAAWPGTTFYVEILDPAPDLCNQELWELGPLAVFLKVFPPFAVHLKRPQHR